MNRRSLLKVGAVSVAGLALPKGMAMTAPLPPAVFISPHFDDDSLALGPWLAQHTSLAQDVHVYWATDSSASGVRDNLNGVGVNNWWGRLHDPVAEGYAILTPADMSAARMVEARNAINAYTSGYSGPTTLHYGTRVDGTLTIAQAQADILALCDSIAPGGPVRLKTMSYTADDHPDHRACGQAVYNLRALYPARFSDVRFATNPVHWTDSRLTGLPGLSTYTPPVGPLRVALAHALLSYGAWNPLLKSFAVGYHSVYSDMFVPMMTTPKTVFHS
jgi:LmbE family N-acetylglucosaminyl deacetylase